MGPEVEYFPNVSAICGTLQLNAIISVPGSECQRTGRDRATSRRLAGGASAPPLLGNHPSWGGTGAISGSSGRGPWTSVGTHGGPARGPVCSMCIRARVHLLSRFCACNLFSVTVCRCARLRHPGRAPTEHRMRPGWQCMCPPSPCVTAHLCVHTLG